MASTTVHPAGIPLASVVQELIFGDLVNVPLAATPEVQFVVLSVAEISSAKHLIELKLVQPENIF